MSKAMPKGRTLEEFQPLKPAEQKLLDCCRNGIPLDLVEEVKDGNSIRGEFLRFMALGGDDQNPVHELGVKLRGALIEGEFNLTSTSVPFDLSIVNSDFEQTPEMKDVKINGVLNLNGSKLQGLGAERALIEGGIYLDKVSSVGKVNLSGSQIGDDLSCRGASFNSGGVSFALCVESAVIKGTVYLIEGFTAHGEVSFLGAQIDGDLTCKNSRIEGNNDKALNVNRAIIKGSVFLQKTETNGGTVSLQGVHIRTDLDCTDSIFNNSNGYAFNADGMIVSGSFFFRNIKKPIDDVSLASAQVRQLVDDERSWGERLVLDGFVYTHINGNNAPTDAAMRLKWLKKQLPEHLQKKQFRPQPWKQLEKVLREMGHNEEARQIGIEFQKQLYINGRIGQPPTNELTIRNCLHQKFVRTIHWLFGLLAAYGYRPLRLFAIMCVIWLACGVFYWYAALQGVMAPSNPLVFQNLPKYECCKSNWYLCDQLPEEYTGFSPMVYSLDVLLPLVNLQQEQDWAPLIPTPKAGWWEELTHFSLKHWVRLVVWFEILFGWVASLLFVAVVSGLSKHSEA